MFVALLVGIYSAYKHFSGLDPLKIDPQAVVSELLAGKVPKEVLEILSSVKVTQGLSNQISQKALGQKKSQEMPAENSKKEAGSAADTANSDASGAGKNLLFRFLLLADSHNDNVDLSKAINQAKGSYPDLKFIIGLGDYTDVGTVEELKKAKKELDSVGLRYFLIPGDHDLWDCRNRQLIPTACFKEVFGPSYQAFTYENFEFLLLNNADNYIGVDQEQSQWIDQELERSKQSGVKGVFVFLHEPLYHPSSDHVMGWVEKSLKSQGQELMFRLKEGGAVKIFAGDIHYFSQYTEPKTGLAMVTVGAVGLERNPQVPRFAAVSVFEDGSTEVEDVEIK